MTTEVLVQQGRHQVRLSTDPADIRAAQDLRAVAFGTSGRDQDSFDQRCQHLLIEDRETESLLGCCRLLLPIAPDQVETSYSAQFYDLSALADHAGPLAELGRFCTRPGAGDGDSLRLAWGAITALVERHQVRFLFGCSSFAGNDPSLYRDSFAMLYHSHQPPTHLPVYRRAPQTLVFRSANLPADPDRKAALKSMPPLLRSYLGMGGWVSDHVVIDPQLNTLHVFTGLDIAAIPPARQRLLRQMAGQVGAG